LRKRSDDIPPKCLNELPQFLQGRTVLFGGRLVQLYIYKDSGRPDFGFGRVDHLESISRFAGARGKHKVLVIDHMKTFRN
jgi:hypothetical protein